MGHHEPRFPPLSPSLTGRSALLNTKLIAAEISCETLQGGSGLRKTHVPQREVDPGERQREREGYARELGSTEVPRKKHGLIED